VQAFFLVINPHPELMALVDKADQEVFVKTLTERSLDAFFTGRGLAVPEYSYAYHLRATLDAARRDNPHTHVILPGTYDSWADGGRLPLYMNRGGGTITSNSFTASLSSRRNSCSNAMWDRIGSSISMPAPLHRLSHSLTRSKGLLTTPTNRLMPGSPTHRDRSGRRGSLPGRIYSRTTAIRSVFW
jgi:hypothetical protein